MKSIIEPQQCLNCSTWRQVYNSIVEKCPYCGDDEYEIHPFFDEDDLTGNEIEERLI